MRYTADVTDGKPIAVWSQSTSGVSAINPLVAFYDIHGGKGEVLFFYFVPDTTINLHLAIMDSTRNKRCEQTENPRKLSQYHASRYSTVNSTPDYTLRTFHRSYFKSVRSNIELQVYSVTICWPYITQVLNFIIVSNCHYTVVSSWLQYVS
jgi:hypothetical protein